MSRYCIIALFAFLTSAAVGQDVQKSSQPRLSSDEVARLNSQIDEIRKNTKLKDYAIKVVPDGGNATTNGCIPKENGGYCCGSEAVCGPGAKQ